MLIGFKKYIEHQQLFESGEKILLAVSGGIDSVVMAHLFHKANVKFGIIHCNFKLRNKESDADEQFVKKLAHFFKVNFFTKKFNTKKYAIENNISIQMAARDLRYDFFEAMRLKHHYNYVALAHNADDSVETVLLNLIRGTGIAGYHGILAKNKKIIRPLLFASREEILNYASNNKIKWREDSSNKEEKYIRNQIRLKIIPLLKKINPSIQDTFQSHISHMNGVESLYREYIQQLINKLLVQNENEITIDINEIKKHNAASTLLYEILNQFGYNSTTAKEIASQLESQPGKMYFSATHQLIKDRQTLILTEKKTDRQRSFMIGPDAHLFEWEHHKLTIRKITLTSDLKEKILSAKVRDENIAYLDADLISFPLNIRKWQTGDCFYPLGMKGKKLVSDYFIDKKYSIVEKRKKWLLTSGNNILWIMGERVDERFKTRESTDTCLQLILEQK